LKSNQNLQCL